MKNVALIAFALFTGAVANAQTQTPAPVTDTAAVLIDTSVGKAYVVHPERYQGLTTETLTAAHIFPALGTYKGSGKNTSEVIITLDEANKGMIWIEGLPQGKFKALMKKAPSTYKIPAQKSENGKAIAEGTLFVDPETNELSIVLGRPFNDQKPTSFLTTASKKTNGWQYKGVKTDAAGAFPASSQQ